MKKIILLIGILIFSNNSYTQNEKATLYLRSGDTIKGFAKILASGKIKFKYNKQSEKETFKASNLIKLDIYDKSSNRPKTYIYKLVQNKHLSAKPALMQPVISGKISLYKNISNHSTASMGVGGMSSTYSAENFFVSKENNDTVIRIASLGPFIDGTFVKKSTKYFEKCPELVELIKNKTFIKKDIEKIVKYYNKKCGKSTNLNL